MKNKFFLLSLLLTAFSAVQISANCNTSCNTCDTSCNTSCNDSCNASCDNSCDDKCTRHHGQVFLPVNVPFAAATPERVSLFESTRLKNAKEDKRGQFQLAVFGGRNTRGRSAAAYFLPYGHKTLTFDGSVNTQSFANVVAESGVYITGTATNGETIGNEYTISGLSASQCGGPTTPVSGRANIAVDPATYKFDTNKDTSKILPWNFGITYAALFEPRGASGINQLVGTGLVTAPQFKSTIAPCLRRWHVGAGAEFTYRFSEEENGFYFRAATAVQHVRSKICLNERIETEKDLLNDDLVAGTPFGNATPLAGIVTPVSTNNSLFLFANATTTVDPVGSLKEAYLNTGFPTDLDGNAPANVTQAFDQAAWKYGKIGCDSRITRLADIELSLGYDWNCGDCATTQWEIGFVAPTGNRPCATFVAPAVVGNGGFFGIRTGSTATVQLSDKEHWASWFRIDTDARYLFRRTQKRSFDLHGKEWSRYMMVWANKEAYTEAVTAAGTFTLSGQNCVADLTKSRNYTPGINVFTTDFCIKPQFNGTFNSALHVAGERFKGELGWTVRARQAECAELSCGWDQAPAFADSSYVVGVGLNNNRTIYNDSQTTVANAVTSTIRGYTLADNILGAASADIYDDFAITSDDINLRSVAAAAAITHTPYLSLGYSFDYESRPTFSVGASYQFSASNSAINEWLVWGKFEVAF